MNHSTSSQHISPAQRFAFYKYQHETWQTAVAFRTTLTLPLIALTLLAIHKNKPLESIVGTGASVIGIRSMQRANFYRRRAAYRLRQQKRSMEGRE